MEKENGETGSDAGADKDSLLDAASLFGAYWSRDGAAGGGGAAAQAAAQAALFGFGGRGYPQPSTLGVAANQAASLGLHPANAAWWSMASHLAAQDYLHRLQASGLSFPPLGDPYSSLSSMQGRGQKPNKAKTGKNERSGRNSSSSTGSSASAKEKSPSTSSALGNRRPSSYNFPKTSSPSTMPTAQPSLSSLASLNSLVSAAHPTKPQPNKHSRKSSKGGSVNERELALLRGDLMLAQAAAQGAYHAAVAAATKGVKSVPPSLFNNPFGLGGSDKDRHSGLDSISGLPHTILSAALEGSDPASVLGGVRLPPDTEIIKYTSSIQGNKSAGSSSGGGRGRKKTISLDPPQVSVLPSTLDRNSGLPSKRQKMDNDYAGSGGRERDSNGGSGSRSSVEVIRLPSRSHASPAPFSLSDYAGLSKELLQSIANQSGLSLAALERELAGSTSTGLNLSTKSSAASEAPLDLGASSNVSNDDDTPLNLSLKPSSSSSTQASDALSRLTSLSSSLSASGHTERTSRRKPGAKPRRVLPETEMSSHAAESPRPKSSGSEDSESIGGWGSAGREGRPRNLGRGVSKPKKNTVASLLAQSRALGLRPALAQQLLAETDTEKLKAILGEVSTDSECLSDSCPSDSDTSESRLPSEAQLRLPLAMGWNRLTVMKGLSRTGCIKGDVSYSPPEPHSNLKLKSVQELCTFLDQNPQPPLGGDNFTFSARRILGNYKQLGLEPHDSRMYNEADITKRLEEARALAALSSVASGRPTPPPPLDRRIELARQQQAARDAKREATQRGRDQARLVRELERSEKAEQAKREKEARNQQMLEAKRKKQEEMERQRIEEHMKRQQEREFKRQQAVLLKEQERERRRQHTTLIRQLDLRRRWEERERRKHQNLMDRLLAKEKKLRSRQKEMKLLAELRRPQEDSTLSDQKPLPTLNRIPGLKLPGQAMGDILQVFEFIHNFGQTLGFDMESLPTLNTLQMALLSDCCQEAEEELMTVLTHLLVCSIEDPGIPHPGRHTTLLGQALRMNDITPANISEVLRIYLFANATGEVKALTGVNQERERERRVADHHQTDAETRSLCHNAKNQIYYEHLHANHTYKLSEALRDKHFLALNSTTKARILAFLCDELLQNKSVLRQVDASLEHLNQLRKERYLQDMKIRKVRVLHQRKLRSEQAERQQALAIERMQRLVEESVAGIDRMERATPHDEDQSMAPPNNPELPKEPPSAESSPSKDQETLDDAEQQQSSPEKDSPEKDKNGKELLNNNKEVASPTDVSNKDSVLGDNETLLSDVESEGTQPEEDEDKNLSSEELARKLEKLLRQSEQQLQQLTASAHSLRATCYGQDRYWRRYWSLGACGGIFVEGMESAQPELLQYEQCLEMAARAREERRLEAEIGRKRRAKTRKSQKDKKTIEQTNSQDGEVKEPEEPVDPLIKTEDQIKSELELKNIKSELNLSDHTQIIKYEPNLKGHCKLEGSPIKMEEKYIQQKQNNELDMLDIEDSIPTAFLVQKPSLNKAMFATQIESIDKPQEVVKIENPAAKTEMDIDEKADEKDPQLVNNLEELRKMAEAMSAKANEESNSNSNESEIKEEKPKEPMDPELAHHYLYTKMLEGRWFSILRKENSLLTNTQDTPEKTEETYPHNVPEFSDNTQTCSEVILCQGHKWDVSNNLHLLNDPSLFTLNSMVTAAQVPANIVYADSSLTMSGIDQDSLDASMQNKLELDDEESDTNSQKEDNDLEKELIADKCKSDLKRNSVGNPLGLLNFNALSTYVTCDSPPPIQMSVDEHQQLEYCKLNGLPKKTEGNFVPRELRHGWWRITDPDMLKDLLEALHPRGVRERELHSAFMQHLPTVNNKLFIDKGDIHNTELSISHLDRVIAQNGGFPSPDATGSYSVKTARRLDTVILEQVEQLEERVASASLQVKGWRPRRTATSPSSENPQSIVQIARGKLAALEANIERRYLKPPLHSSGDATLGAVLQAESQASAPSPHTPEKNNDGTIYDGKETKGLPRGLVTWREAVSRCQTSSQISMVLSALEGSIAWDKSIMKANCQFCQNGDNDDKLLLCDGCDKGYHTYCFKPKMDKIPDGDWYCWECVNKARGDKVCIVCGGAASGGGRGRLLPCTLCARAYHQSCHYPPLHKSPRGKWYCVNCISKAPPKKPRTAGKKRDSKRDHSASFDNNDQQMVPSPAPSHASTSTTADDCQSVCRTTPEKQPEVISSKTDVPSDPENGLNHHTGKHDCQSVCRKTPEMQPKVISRNTFVPSDPENGLNHHTGKDDCYSVSRTTPEKQPEVIGSKTDVANDPENGLNHHTETADLRECEEEPPPPVPERRRPPQYVGGNGVEAHSDSEEAERDSRQEKKRDKGKRLQRELHICRTLLEEMELHRDAWPFLLPVNTKQFPTYKKIIRAPMDLSTIKRKLQDGSYSTAEEFASDVRQMFSNCEVFNEDESPVGQAGHGMRRFFTQRLHQLQST